MCACIYYTGQVIANTLNQKSKMLERIFRSFDANHSGDLDAKELRAGLRAGNLNMTQARARVHAHNINAHAGAQAAT
jgi:Ca2+-binding EF-hand superfamily protein